MAGPRRSRTWLLLVAFVAMVVVTPPAGVTATPAAGAATRLTTEHWYLGIDATTDRWGRVLLVATRAGSSGGVVYLRPRRDGTWSEEPVSPEVSPGPRAIAIGRDGRIVVAWATRRAIRVASAGADGWTTESFAARLSGGSPFDLALSPDGTPYVAWLTETPRGWERLQLATRGGDGWRTRDLGPANGYDPVTLAVSDDGAVHLGYSRTGGGDGAQGDNRVWYARVSDGVVTRRRLGAGIGARLVLDDAGEPMMGWTPAGRSDIAVARKGSDGWRFQRAALPGFFWDISGFTLHRGRPVIAGDYDDLHRVSPMIATVLPGGDLRQRTIPSFCEYQTASLVSMVGDVLGMPCRTRWTDQRGTQPGIGIGIVGPSFHRVQPVAVEERYEAIWATSPDGAVEIVTRRSNGDLALRIRSGGTWVRRPLPPLPGFRVADMAIGAGGERAIVGTDGRGVLLLTDRSGRWEVDRVAQGTLPQVAIDARGRIHIGWERGTGEISAELRLAVGTPGAWQRWTVPSSHAKEGYRSLNRPFFFARPDGQDIVVWHRRTGPKATHGTVMRTRDADGWRSERLSREWFEELWSADLSPDGTLGLVRGGLSDADLVLIRPGGRRIVEDIPFATFFGASLTFDRAGRAAMLAAGWELDRLFLIRRGPDGWSRRPLAERWSSARLAFEGNRPLLLARRAGTQTDDAGLYLVRPR